MPSTIIFLRIYSLLIFLAGATIPLGQWQVFRWNCRKTLTVILIKTVCWPVTFSRLPMPMVTFPAMKTALTGPRWVCMPSWTGTIRRYISWNLADAMTVLPVLLRDIVGDSSLLSPPVMIWHVPIISRDGTFRSPSWSYVCLMDVWVIRMVPDCMTILDLWIWFLILPTLGYCRE